MEEVNCVVGKNSEEDLWGIGDEDQDARWEGKRWKCGVVLTQV